LEIDEKLLCDPSEKAQREADNGVEQIDYIADLVNDKGARELRESHVRGLHALAIQNIYSCGGQYRPTTMEVKIQGSKHTIPDQWQVPGLVRDMVDWNNSTMTTKPALERAAYVLWRFNWIHPFSGGNGRTARALSYLIVCMGNRATLPGVPTMPSLIYAHRADYIAALKDADARESESPGSCEVSAMKDFLKLMLTKQLAGAIDSLAGAR
jgi:Fic family protein